MSSASKKGYDGDVRFAEINTNAVEPHFEVVRKGGQETARKGLQGDNIVLKDHDNDCVLSDYFLESKRQKQPNVWRHMDEAEHNAEKYNKKGAVLYLSRARGVGKPVEERIVMMPETYQRIINELQSWRMQFKNGDLIEKGEDFEEKEEVSKDLKWKVKRLKDAAHEVFKELK